MEQELCEEQIKECINCDRTFFSNDEEVFCPRCLGLLETTLIECMRR